MIENTLIEQCLRPIATGSPVGIDLRTDTSLNSRYYQLKDRRNAVRDLERRHAQGENADERADWETIAKLCVETLIKYSKDLEVASWLVEALLRREGLKGLTAGFSILSGLITNYWDILYPLPDVEDPQSRLGALINLNGTEYEGTLIRPLYHVLVTQGNSVGPFALWQYQQALENAKLTNSAAIERRKAEGSVFLASIQVAVQETPMIFYETLQHDLKNAKEVFSHYNQLMTNQCGNNAPPQTRINNALDDFADHLRFILKDSIHEQPLRAAQPTTIQLADNKTSPVEVITSDGSMPNELNNREHALKMLGAIASYFRQTEPQSILPYMLERAQQLGRLSFPELLKELINDDSARLAAYKLMGVKMAEETT